MRTMSEKPSDMYSGASTVQKGICSPVNLFRGGFLPREFVPCATNSVGTTFFEPVNFFPTRGIYSLFACHTVSAVTLFFMRGTRC